MSFNSELLFLPQYPSAPPPPVSPQYAASLSANQGAHPPAKVIGSLNGRKIVELSNGAEKTQYIVFESNTETKHLVAFKYKNPEILKRELDAKYEDNSNIAAVCTAILAVTGLPIALVVGTTVSVLTGVGIAAVVTAIAIGVWGVALSSTASNDPIKMIEQDRRKALVDYQIAPKFYSDSELSSTAFTTPAEKRKMFIEKHQADTNYHGMSSEKSTLASENAITIEEQRKLNMLEDKYYKEHRASYYPSTVNHSLKIKGFLDEITRNNHANIWNSNLGVDQTNAILAALAQEP